MNNLRNVAEHYMDDLREQVYELEAELRHVEGPGMSLLDAEDIRQVKRELTDKIDHKRSLISLIRKTVEHDAKKKLENTGTFEPLDYVT